MIKRGLGEPIITEHQRLIESLPMVVNLGELDFAYLRPQRAGRIHRTVHNGWGNPNPPNYPGYGWYSTRAQAAQVAYG